MAKIKKLLIVSLSKKELNDKINLNHVFGKIGNMIDLGYNAGIDAPVNWHLKNKKNNDLEHEKNQARKKAIEGVLHHNENTKKQFKLPKSLINELLSSR